MKNLISRLIILLSLASPAFAGQTTNNSDSAMPAEFKSWSFFVDFHSQAYYEIYNQIGFTSPSLSDDKDRRIGLRFSHRQLQGISYNDKEQLDYGLFYLASRHLTNYLSFQSRWGVDYSAPHKDIYDGGFLTANVALLANFNTSNDLVGTSFYFGFEFPVLNNFDQDKLVGAERNNLNVDTFVEASIVSGFQLYF